MQGILRQMGLDQTAINGIDGTGEPVLYNRCAYMVEKFAAADAWPGIAPGDPGVAERWRDELNVMVADMLRSPQNFLAELYSANAHSQMRSHIQSPGATDADADTDNDDVTPVVRRDDKW